MDLGWWLVAALLFLPRWLFLVPILPLAIAAIRARRKAVYAVVAADLLLVLGPFMGFVVPIHRLVFSWPGGPTVRVMSFNVAARKIDGPRLIRYLERQNVDVVCFQEPNSTVGLEADFVEAGWHFGREGRVASRFPIVRDLGRVRDKSKPETRESMIFARVRLQHPDGFTFLVGSAHLPTPRRAFDRLLAGDFQGCRERLAAWDDELLRLRESMGDAGATPLIVGGDFNMPADYQRMASLRGTYPSGFDQAGWGYGYTRPTSLPWVRIDHVVASRHWSFTQSWLGPDFGSDHLPIIADAVLIERKLGD
jgi:endonuclease/exonuclease/phosphatase family metal-dependent hydrolase